VVPGHSELPQIGRGVWPSDSAALTVELPRALPGQMNTAELIPVISPLDDQILRLAVAAHLARYKGQTRVHTASDLSSYFN